MFLRFRNVRKNGHFANGKPAVSPEAKIRFPGSETSKNGYFVKGARPFIRSGGNVFQLPKLWKKSKFRYRQTSRFAGEENRVSEAPKRPKMVTSRTGTRLFNSSAGNVFYVRKRRKSWSFRQR